MTWQRLFENPNIRWREELNADGTRSATFHLRDYLGPRGYYPYEDLPKDMTTAFRLGMFVYLISVPGFLMVSAFPGMKKPWCVDAAYGGKRMKCFHTAAEAVRGR